MADFSSRSMAIRDGGKVSSSSVAVANGNWDGAGGLDQITVVRIDDTHIEEEQSHVRRKVKSDATDYYEVEYSMPTEEEAAGEEEEDSVYVIEYSNPEEEGESYQFTMSVDRSLPVKKTTVKHPAAGESSRAPSQVISRPRPTVRQERKLVREEEVKKETIVSNKSVLELGEDYSDVMGSGKRMLMCSMCPPPGRFFKRASGLAVHLKQLHQVEGKKTFFCTYCNQTVRTQIQLDAHTRRHANQDAVFTCHLCLTNKLEITGYKGSKHGLKRHLEKEHPGVIPRCDICNKGFKTLTTYLADQFRHVGVSPYYCAKCQIYEMTERGLSVHIKNHNKKKTKQESGENHLQTFGVSTSVDNSATDDSDF
ncbi:zinc finger protein 567-like isoform X2 [Anabas testudineus]|uniref:zinc finger protein 567-like isoform X2 n=1 Tax=Anabas testudineus TaxID=64144 RepID=UPI000E4541F6|nr:zinc finger protein 567-like isoform X2 [Anabas testudineus]